MPAATRMVHDMAVWNVDMCQPQRHAMRFSGGASEGQDAVAVFVFLPRPQQTIARWHRLGSKALDFRGGGCCRLWLSGFHQAIMAHMVMVAA